MQEATKRQKLFLKAFRSRYRKQKVRQPWGQVWYKQSKRFEAAVGLALMRQRSDSPPLETNSSETVKVLQETINKMRRVMSTYVASRSHPDKNIQSCLAELFPEFVDYARLSSPQLRSILSSRNIGGFTTKTRKVVLVRLLVNSERPIY